MDGKLISGELITIVQSYRHIFHGLPYLGIAVIVLGISRESFRIYMVGVIVLAGSLSAF